MHQTSTLHPVQPTLALPSKANFLFYVKAFFKSLVKERDKKIPVADNSVMDDEQDDVSLEESLVSGPVYFRQYTLERKEGKLVYFGKWCHMTPVEESLAQGSKSKASINSQSSVTTPSSIKFLNRKSMQRKLRLLGITLSVILLSFVTNSVFAQTVQTDKPDYMPGDYVVITGSGWRPGETVVLHFDETPKPITCLLSHDVIAVADANGDIYNNRFLVKPNHIGVSFILTATGQTSESIAETYFTDAAFTSAANGDWSNRDTWAFVARTGTLTVSLGSTSVTGSAGSSFLTELVVGDKLYRTTGGSNLIGTVASISSNTSLTLESGALDANAGSYQAKKIPGAADVVTIGAGHTVTVNGTFFCTSLSINSGNNATAFLDFKTTGDPSLTVAGVVLIGHAGNANREGAITFASGSTLTAGSLSLGALGSQASSINMTAGGLLKVGGTITTFSSSTWTPGTGTVELTATNTLPAAIINSFNNLVVSGGTTTLSVATSISGNVTIASGATLDESSRQMTLSSGSVLTVNGTLDFSNANGEIRSGTSGTSTLTMGSTGLIKTTDLNGLGPATNASFSIQAGGAWNTSSITTNGTIEYNRTSAQPITDINYNNLTITNTGTKTWTLGGTRTVNGNLTLNTNAPLILSGTQTINLKGNWSNSGTFTAGTSTIKMNGASAQTMIGSTFYNLVIDNTAGVTLNSAESVTNNLSITSGSFLNLNTFTHSAGTLTLDTDGSVAGSWGHSSSPATYENDIFFTSATGIVNVTTNTCPDPTISDDPDDVTACVGTSVIFSATASGPGNISFQWYKENGATDIALNDEDDGGDIQIVLSNSNNTSTLTINNTAVADAGDYYVIVTRACGSTAASSAATLIANTLPSLDEQPQNQSITYGANATFTVAASGTALNYQWQEDAGSGFSNITIGGVYSDPTLATLTLTKPTVNMSTYKYRCVISGTCTPSATSDDNVTLTVNKLLLTVGAPTLTKTRDYNGLTGAEVTAGSLTNKVGSEDVTVSAVANYDNKNQGTVKTITTVYSIAGTDAGNYNKPPDYVVNDGVINKAAVAVTAVTATKTYDGTTASSASPTVGTLVSGDVVNAAPTQVYDNKNYGLTHVLNASGLTIKDADDANMTGNYTITYNPSPATGVINKAAVAVTAVTATKTYDGTTASSASPTVGTLVSGDVVNAAPTQVYDNKNYGLTHVLNASGLTIKDADDANMTGNYTITYNPSPATGVINKAAVAVTAVTATKTYDGTTASSASPTVGTLVSGDVVNAAPTQVYDNKNYGLTHVLNASGLTIKDADDANMTGNYTITYNPSPATGVINKAAVAVTAVTATKTYDGTTASSASPTVGTLVSGDVVNAAPTQVYDNKNYGLTHVLNASGLTIKDADDANMTGNYTITYNPSPATGVINKAAVAVTAVTATKTYDGTTASSASPTVGTLVSGDVVNAAPTQVYDNKNYGLTHVLNASGLTIKDADDANMTGNYTITYNPSPATGVINKAAVAVTAVTATKTYDGTTASSASPTVGTLVSGDVVNAAPTQVYDNKNYGLTHVLNASGLTIKDADDANMTGNYTITYNPSPATGVINKAAVAVTAVTATKTYDGTTASSASPTVGTLVSGDVVNAAPTQVYDNKNYGLTHVLNASGLTIKDADDANMTGNYTITYNPSPATGVINKAAVAVTAVTATKTYDGTTASSASPTVGTLVSGDVVNAAPTQVYDNKNYGLTHVLNASGLTIKDADDANMTGNYTITYNPSPATGVINKAAVAVTAVTATKTYDGTTASSASPTVGTLVSGDVVNAAPTQVYDNKNYGLTHVLNASGLTIKDADDANMTGNYTITYNPSPATGVINKAAVAVTAVTATKTYDGTTASSASPTVGTLVSGDVVNAAPTQVYDNKNYGLTHVLNASGLTIKDADDANMTGNYTITYNPSPATGVINKAAVAVTAVTATKTYDGTTASSASPTVGTLVSGDVVNAAPTQVYDNKNYGLTHVLNASGLTIKDADDANMTGNYTITYNPSPATGVINKAAVAVTAVTATKTYDGTTASSASPTVGTLVSGDVVNAAPTQVYDNKNYGLTHVLNASGLTIKDADDANMTGNYTITYNPSPATGVINKAAVAVTAVTATKTYDGTTASSASPTVGTLVSGDVVNAAPTQVYDNKNYGLTHVLNASGLTIKDADDANMTGNYTITYNPSPATGVINPRSINLTGTRMYNGTTTFNGSTLSYTGTLGSETVTLGGTGEVSSPNVGTYTSFSSNNITTGNLNYTAIGGTVTVTITPQTANPIADKFYTGGTFFWTTNATSSNATLVLAASLKNNINYTGDITTAKVSFFFKSGTSWTPITGAQNLPVGLIDPANPSLGGTASALVQYNLGSATMLPLDIAIKIGGNYSASTTDPACVKQITVAVPLPGGQIVGGGTIDHENANGYIAGPSTIKTSEYSFEVKFNKSLTNPQGKVEFTVSSFRNPQGQIDGREHTYKIKSTAIASLVVGKPKLTDAEFTSKVNITEVMPDGSNIGVESGVNMVLTLFDGELSSATPKPKDKLGVTVYRKNGGVWYSNNWVINQTVAKEIKDGQVCIRTEGATQLQTARINTNVSAAQPNVLPVPTVHFDLKAYPNPTTSYFNVKLESSNITQPMTLNVVDVSGKRIETRKNLVAGQSLQLGANYRPGMYFVELIQGDTRRIVKLVKQPD